MLLHHQVAVSSPEELSLALLPANALRATAPTQVSTLIHSVSQ
jgi:hypothetical protein